MRSRVQTEGAGRAPRPWGSSRGGARCAGPCRRRGRGLSPPSGDPRLGRARAARVRPRRRGALPTLRPDLRFGPIQTSARREPERGRHRRHPGQRHRLHHALSLPAGHGRRHGPAGERAALPSRRGAMGKSSSPAARRSPRSPCRGLGWPDDPQTPWALNHMIHHLYGSRWTPTWLADGTSSRRARRRHAPAPGAHALDGRPGGPALSGLQRPSRQWLGRPVDLPDERRTPTGRGRAQPVTAPFDGVLVYAFGHLHPGDSTDLS